MATLETHEVAVTTCFGLDVKGVLLREFVTMIRRVHELASPSSVLRGGSVAELDKEWIVFLLKHRNCGCTMVTS